MIEVLNILSSQLAELGLNYEFGRMTKSPPTYPYWVGEIVADSGIEGPWIDIIKRAAIVIYITVIKSIKDFFVALWNDIVGIFKQVSGWFNQNIAQPIKDIFTSIWNKMKSGASSAWTVTY